MKKFKDIIKRNPEPAKGKFGINPMDPWSVKYGIAEDDIRFARGKAGFHQLLEQRTCINRAAHFAGFGRTQVELFASADGFHEFV